jgi:integrase
MGCHSTRREAPERAATSARLSSRDEETRLLGVARQSRSRSLYPALVVAIHTGLQSAELRNLQWSRVDLLAGFLLVGKSKTADGEGRIVPVSATALAKLKDWRAVRRRQACPLHFSIRAGWPRRAKRQGIGPCRGIRRGPDQADRQLEDGVQRCEEDPWRAMPDPRHTAHVLLARRKPAPEQTLTAMAGWMSRKMLETYSHSRMGAKRRVVAAFDLPDRNGLTDEDSEGTKPGTVQ